ncbi:MAG: response regulator [Ectothiorhodospiraceae bacterium]|nr:response regulator [Ectothiorhodospiraceae bacterium]
MAAVSILVVDDNAQNLYLARYLLEQKGYTVSEARNGEDAVAVNQAEKPVLILMDIQMPGMDGLEATRCIKNQASAPCVVALTARAMSGDRERILAAGCDGYIEKPIDPENFVGKVEGYLLETRL